MKLRLTQSFKDAVTDFRRAFGVEGNNLKMIVKRALILFNKTGFEYSIPNDKTVGSPVTINFDFKTTGMQDLAEELNAKEIQGIVIAYIQNQIEKSLSRRQPVSKFDETVNFRVDND